MGSVKARTKISSLRRSQRAAGFWLAACWNSLSYSMQANGAYIRSGGTSICHDCQVRTLPVTGSWPVEYTSTGSKPPSMLGGR